MKFLTFPYAGREPKTISTLLKVYPELKSSYIYDVNLSTGSLLYSCGGGIGITTEKYIVEMHKFIKSSTFISTLKGTFEYYFDNRFSPRKFLVMQERFNNQTIKLQNYRQCAELYLIWCCSSYTHRYRNEGHYGQFFPSILNWEQLENASRLSREKNLLYEKRNFFSMREEIINDNTIIYCHLPPSYGAYGCGFMWKEETFRQYVRNLIEFDTLGYRVCISTPHLEKSALYQAYKSSLASFRPLTLSKFKVPNVTHSRQHSDTYFLNF